MNEANYAVQWKDAYAVQWFDTSESNKMWRNDYKRYDTIEDAVVALESHKAQWPTIDTRLVKLETRTTVQQITLSTLEES